MHVYYTPLADLEKSKGGFTTTRQWLLSRCLYKITLGRETISTEYVLNHKYQVSTISSRVPCDPP